MSAATPNFSAGGLGRRSAGTGAECPHLATPKRRRGESRARKRGKRRGVTRRIPAPTDTKPPAPPGWMRRTADIAPGSRAKQHQKVHAGKLVRRSRETALGCRTSIHQTAPEVWFAEVREPARDSRAQAHQNAYAEECGGRKCGYGAEFAHLQTPNAGARRFGARNAVVAPGSTHLQTPNVRASRFGALKCGNRRGIPALCDTKTRTPKSLVRRSPGMAPGSPTCRHQNANSQGGNDAGEASRPLTGVERGR